MENLKEILLPEIEEFRKVGHKFMNGEISVADFTTAEAIVEKLKEKQSNNIDDISIIK